MSVFAAFIMLVVVAGFVLFLLSTAQRTVATSLGPAQRRVDFIETQGPFFFSMSDVRLVLRDENGIRATVDSTVANDGKALDDKNWQVKWLDRGVEVQLLGEEQDPQVCTLTLEGTTLCMSKPRPSATPELDPPVTPKPDLSTAPPREPEPQSATPLPLPERITQSTTYTEDRKTLEAVACHLGVMVNWDLDARANLIGVLSTTQTHKDGYTYNVREILRVTPLREKIALVFHVQQFSSTNAPLVDDNLLESYEVDTATDTVTEAG